MIYSREMAGVTPHGFIREKYNREQQPQLLDAFFSSEYLHFCFSLYIHIFGLFFIVYQANSESLGKGLSGSEMKSFSR